MSMCVKYLHHHTDEGPKKQHNNWYLIIILLFPYLTRLLVIILEGQFPFV